MTSHATPSQRNALCHKTVSRVTVYLQRMEAALREHPLTLQKLTKQINAELNCRATPKNVWSIIKSLEEDQIVICLAPEGGQRGSGRMTRAALQALTDRFKSLEEYVFGIDANLIKACHSIEELRTTVQALKELQGDALDDICALDKEVVAIAKACLVEGGVDSFDGPLSAALQEIARSQREEPAQP